MDVHLAVCPNHFGFFCLTNRTVRILFLWIIIKSCKMGLFVNNNEFGSVNVNRHFFLNGLYSLS